MKPLKASIAALVFAALFFSCSFNTQSDYGTLVLGLPGSSASRAVGNPGPDSAPLDPTVYDLSSLQYHVHCSGAGSVSRNFGYGSSVSIPLTAGVWDVTVNVINRYGLNLGSNSVKGVVIEAGSSTTIGIPIAINPDDINKGGEGSMGWPSAEMWASFGLTNISQPPGTQLAPNSFGFPGAIIYFELANTNASWENTLKTTITSSPGISAVPPMTSLNWITVSPNESVLSYIYNGKTCMAYITTEFINGIYHLNFMVLDPLALSQIKIPDWLEDLI